MNFQKFLSHYHARSILQLAMLPSQEALVGKLNRGSECYVKALPKEMPIVFFQKSPQKYTFQSFEAFLKY
jgi:hypothetical protein